MNDVLMDSDAKSSICFIDAQSFGQKKLNKTNKFC